MHTQKGVIFVSADGTVVNSDESVTAALDRDRPYCDDDGEPLCSAGGDPILLRHFLNDPD